MQSSPENLDYSQSQSLMDQVETSRSKRRNPGINVVIAMYGCLLPDFLLSGALCRILVGVPYCKALLKLSITLNLNPAESEENLQVQKEGTQVCHNYYICCLLSEFHLTGALHRILAGVPYCGALLRLNYSQGEIYG